MRLRNIPKADQVMENCSFVIKDAAQHKGDWANIFGNEHPVHIEVGMGKGRFITEMAVRNPEINYVGIERYSSVLLRAVEKLEDQAPDNLRFLCLDAGELPEIFAAGEVAKIYLNFSDPWPKERHAKRRLTSPRFMQVYDQILKEDGRVEFKTDNRELFDYSLESIPEAGWTVEAHTFDLHHSDMAEGNIMTEYEEKFSGEGKFICKLVAAREKHTEA